jgi:hypothetical protein
MGAKERRLAAYLQARIYKELYEDSAGTPKRP